MAGETRAEYRGRRRAEAAAARALQAKYSGADMEAFPADENAAWRLWHSTRGGAWPGAPVRVVDAGPARDGAKVGIQWGAEGDWWDEQVPCNVWPLEPSQPRDHASVDEWEYSAGYDYWCKGGDEHGDNLL